MYVCAPWTRATSTLPRPIRGLFWLLNSRRHKMRCRRHPRRWHVGKTPPGALRLATDSWFLASNPEFRSPNPASRLRTSSSHKSISFHQLLLSEIISSLFFSNFYSGAKTDIFSTLVFNNFYWLTFIFNLSFFRSAVQPNLINQFTFNDLAI